MQITR